MVVYLKGLMGNRVAKIAQCAQTQGARTIHQKKKRRRSDYEYFNRINCRDRYCINPLRLCSISAYGNISAIQNNVGVLEGD